MIHKLKRKIGVGQRLRQFIGSMHPDTFGLKQRTTESILAYLKIVGNERGVPPEDLRVMLSYLPNHRLQILLYDQASIVAMMNMNQFLDLMGVSGLVPRKVEEKLMKYLVATSEKYQIPIRNLKMAVCQHERDIIINLLNGEEAREIQLTEVLNHFLS